MKKQIRKEYLSKRKQFTSTEINAWSQAIAKHFFQTEFMDAQTFHVFLSMPKFNEVNTQYIIEELWRQNRDVVVPKMKEKQLLSCPYNSETVLIKNDWGIMEPASCTEVEPKLIDIVIVPLLIADKRGNRIGYGGGYYDRFLSKLSDTTKFIGINFFEPIDEVLHEDFDILLDYLITPNAIYTFDKV